MSGKTILTLVADSHGEVFEHPRLLLAGMNGTHIAPADPEDLIPLPEGSRLFTIPGTPPIGIDPDTGEQVALTHLPEDWGGGAAQAVSAFVIPGFTRTLLPAADYARKPVELTLWSYTAIGWCVEEERFYVAAIRVDRNRQWEPRHFDDRLLEPLVHEQLNAHPHNRLLRQLSRCALDYHCFAAKNLFFGRWEAPLPCSPQCNARCVGCISLQDDPGACQASQDRLDFVPSAEEICAIAIPHLEHADRAIVSFGQGCEGDPILQAGLVAESIRTMRRQTTRGTINFNTNASLPAAVDLLATAGLDSIRISLNSVREPLYNAYYRPRGYAFADILDAAHRARANGLFTTLNYLVFPGITDQPEEVDRLLELLDSAGIDMIQMRNLSIDPHMYLQALNSPEPGIGIRRMLDRVKSALPHIQFGYFNRTRENFYPDNYRHDWPLPHNLDDE